MIFPLEGMELLLNDQTVYHNPDYYPIDEIAREFQINLPVFNNVS